MNRADSEELVANVNRLALEAAHLKGEVDRLSVQLEQVTADRDRVRASRTWLVRRLNHSEAAVLDLKDRLSRTPDGTEAIRAHLTKFFTVDDTDCVEADLVQALAVLTGRTVTIGDPT